MKTITTEVEIFKRTDYQLTSEDRTQLKTMLEEAFPGFFKERIFYKQIPSFRLIACLDGAFIGHIGVIHRAISIEGQVYEIFGIVDLCTSLAYRNQGIASKLMVAVHELAEQSGVNHVILFADEEEQAFYQRFDYQLINAKCKFLAIEDMQSHSLMEKDCRDILMIKSGNADIFRGKTIDLLGEMF